MTLKDKIVFISGGTRGIGLAIALKCLEHHATVIVSGRDNNKLEELSKKYSKLETLPFDVLNDSQINNVIEQLQTQFGGIDILINNAAILYSGNIVTDQFSFEMIEKEVLTNVAAPIKLTKKILPLLLKSEKGTVVNISSAVANLPMISLPVYSATKAALRSFSISLRESLKGKNLNVLEVQPPLVKTEMTSKLPGEAKDAKMITPEECAKQIVKGIIQEKETLFIGSSNSLYWGSRIAPKIVQKQINRL